MLRAEAMASSRLEGIYTDARSLGEAELGIGENPAALLVANIVRAMETVLGSDLGVAVLLDAPGVLLEGVPGAGTWRQEPVWIGSSGRSANEAHFVPPAHGRVPELMDDLMTYALRIDLPPLAQAAIAHAQFETIHLFTDGSGRIGRALVYAILEDADIAGSGVAPLSVGLLADKKHYHRPLDVYREGCAEPIVELFAESAFRAAGTGMKLAEETSTVSAVWRERLIARVDSAVWPVLELLATWPVFSPAVLELELGLGYMRMNRAMDSLVARTSRQWMG